MERKYENTLDRFTWLFKPRTFQLANVMSPPFNEIILDAILQQTILIQLKKLNSTDEMKGEHRQTTVNTEYNPPPHPSRFPKPSSLTNPYLL